MTKKVRIKKGRELTKKELDKLIKETNRILYANKKRHY